MRFCEMIKYEKEKRLLSLDEFSNLIGLPRTTVWNHLNGDIFPSRRSFRKYISGLFDLESIDDLGSLYYAYKDEEQ